jgi:hypothetical protein
VENDTMTLIRCARIAGKRPGVKRAVRRHLERLRGVGGAAVATLVVAVGCGQAASPAVAAGDEPPVPSKNAVAPSSFVSDSRKTLRKLEEEILSLAKQAMETADTTRNRAINQQITVKSAAANYENAKLTREVAEIALVEYREGIFLQDQATIEGELRFAEFNLSRATEAIGPAKDRVAKIKDASDGSLFDLGLEFSYEDRIGEAELEESKARMAVQKAQSKLDPLRNFTKPKCIKELQVEVEKARAAELASQARWEHEKMKLAKLEAAVKEQNGAPLPEQRAPSLLKRALSIAEELKAKLDLAAKDSEPNEAARQKITDLMAQLQVIVEQVPAARAADQWAALKPKVHAAALRYLQAKPTGEAK